MLSIGGPNPAMRAGFADHSYTTAANARSSNPQFHMPNLLYFGTKNEDRRESSSYILVSCSNYVVLLL